MRPGWKQLDESISYLDKNVHLKKFHRNENTDIIYNDYICDVVDSIDSKSTFIYPDYNKLYYKLSDFLDTNADNIILTNGCDGALKHVFEYFTGYKKIMYYNDTYKGACHYGDLYKTHNNTKTLLYICNPNNPTGNILTINEIVELSRLHDFILVDEAYYEFSGVTVLPLIDEIENIAIARSFSKAWGLAGYRIGLLLTHKTNVNNFMQYRPTSPVTNIGIQLLSKLLDNYSEVQQSVNRIKQGTKHLFDIYNDRGYHIYDTTNTNFVYVKIPQEIIKKMQTKWFFKVRDDNWCIITTQPVDQYEEIY